MQIDLKGKSALVTGASRGIGEAIARELASSGCKVGLHFSNSEVKANEIKESVGNNVYLFKADLSNPEEATSLWEEVVNRFNKVDILVNNAGIAIASPVDGENRLFLEHWNKTMDVNLTSLGLLCKEAINHFRQFEGGTIINISSRAAFRGDTSEYLAYAASKGGVVALTRSIARAYGKEGIVAFNVAPGFVMTDMALDFVEKYGEDFIKNDIALSELTKPEDVAPMVVFLSSGNANHATGGTFDINAGSYVH